MLPLLSANRLLVHCERYNVSSAVVTVKPLHIPTARADGAEIVKPYQVRPPLPSFHVGEQWGIRRHIYDIGITLNASKEGSLKERGMKMVPLLALTVAGILAGKHLGAFPVVIVITAARSQEPIFRTIEMLVNKVNLKFPHLRPKIFKILSLGVRASRTDNLDVWISLAYSIDKHFQTRRISLAPLLIAHGDILQVERRRMPHTRAQTSPHCSGITVGELYKVKRVLYVATKVVNLNMGILVLVLKLARKAAAYNRQRLGSHVLRQKEKLVKAHSVRLKIVREKAVLKRIVPPVLVQRTVFHRANGVLPIITGGQISTLDNATARKTEHTRLGVGQGLRQILTQTVFASLPCIYWEKGHMFQVYISV